MQLPMTFCGQLSQIMAAHKLSFTALGTAIGAKADLKHVLLDDGTEAKRHAVFERIRKSSLFSSEELAALLEALNVSKLGQSLYMTRQSLSRFMKSERPDFAPITIVGGKPLSQLLTTIAGAQSIRILCVNSCSMPLFATLASLFTNKQRNIEMRHYVHTGMPGCDAATLIRCVSPILFDSRYIPYTIGDESSALTAQHICSNILVVQTKTGSTQREYLLTLKDDETVYELSGAARTGLFDYYKQMIGDLLPKPQLIKENRKHQLTFVSFMMLLLSRELNRATYYLGGDICFMQVPPSIAKAAFIDASPFDEEQTAQYVEQLLPLFEQRYHNFFFKKKPNYCAMRIDALQSFLETGRGNDHFVYFRAFKPDERIQIFETMIEMANENPNYHPLLLKQSNVNYRYFTACYDSLVTTICSTGSNYNVEGNYDHITILSPDFTRQYRDNFLDVIIKEECYTREQSVKMLQDMLNEFRSKQA